MIQHFTNLAKELGVVLPISFFERAGQVFFNSLVVADADGTIKGLLPQISYPAKPGLRREILFFTRKYGVSSHRNQIRQIGLCDMLGSMVSRSSARHDFDGG